MKRILFAALVAATVECSATVYRPGLVQAKFNGSDIGFKTSVQPSLISNLLSQAQVDFAYGTFMANFSANGKDLYENPWSGNSWGWNDSYTLFAYEGQVYLHEGEEFVMTGAFDDGSAVVVEGVTLFEMGSKSGYSGGPDSHRTFTAPADGWYPLNAWVWDWSGGKVIGKSYVSGCQYWMNGVWADFTNAEKWSKLEDPGDGSFLRVATAESFSSFGGMEIAEGVLRFPASFFGVPDSGATLRLYYGDRDAGDTRFGWKGFVEVASVSAGDTASTSYSVPMAAIHGSVVRLCLCHADAEASTSKKCVGFEEWGAVADIRALDPDYPRFGTGPSVVGTLSAPKLAVDLLSGAAELRLVLRKAGTEVRTEEVLAESVTGPFAAEYPIAADAGCAYTLELLATTARGSAVRFDLGTFLFAELGVSVSDAREAGFVAGRLVLTRPDTASSTAEDLVVNYSVSGTAVAGAQYAELSGTVTIPAGETSAAIEVKPILDILVKKDVAVVIDLVPDGFYLPQTSYAVTVVNDPDAVRDPLIRYVSESGSDTGNDGQTEATPFRTVSRAVLDIAADGGRVFVAPGRYEETALLTTGEQGEETSAIVLDHGISVIGATGDPSDVVITRAVVNNTYPRIFLVKHPDALVTGVTIDNGYSKGPGGNVWITSAGGTVENCIIENGRMNNGGGTYWWACGANVYQQGGRVSRCIIQGGSASYSGGARVEGGVMENSLIRDNVCPGSEVGAVELRNSAVLANCTVTGNSSLTVSGVRACHDTVTVINCAIFGNTSTSDATGHAHVWDGKSGCFVNCVGEVAPNEFCFAGPSGFVDAASGDCRLTVASSALDRGASYAATPAKSSVDLDGNPRVSGAAVDVGCYEYQDDGSFAAEFALVGIARAVVPAVMEFRANAINTSGTVTYAWDVNGDGVSDEIRTDDPTLVWTYDGRDLGTLGVILTISDEAGHSATLRKDALVFVSPRVLYADPANAAGSLFPFDTPETAGTNLAEVVAAASSGCTVLLADGTYGLTNELIVAADVDIRSISGDPARCVIRQTKRMGFDFLFYSRVVHLNSPGARLSGVTLLDGYGVQVNGNGCGLLIDVLGGTASNIVIRAGYACNYSAEGGGALIRNGLLVRAEITGCDCENGKDQGVASALVVEGDGRAEDCLVHGNGYRSTAGGVVAVKGNGVLANCTVVSNRIVGCADTKNNAQRYAVMTANSGRVVNCVIAGTECSSVIPDTDVNWLGADGSFVNCATDYTSSADPAWRAASGEEMFRDYAAGDYRPRTGGVLTNGGTDAVGFKSSVDLAGRPRVTGRSADIGCYEGNPMGIAIFVR